MAAVGIKTNLVVEHWELLQTKTKVHKLSIAYRTPLAHQYKPFCRGVHRTSPKTKVHKLNVSVMATVGISIGLQDWHLFVTEYTGRLQTETKVYKLSFAYGTPWAYQYKLSCRWQKRESLKTKLSIAYGTPRAYQYKRSCRWPQRKSLNTKLSIAYGTPWAYH